MASIKSKIFWFKYYKKSFTNYLSVLKNVAQEKFPITLVLKNGNKIIAKTKDEVALYALTESNTKYEYHKTNDLLIIFLDKEKTKVLKLYGISKSIDAIMTFSKLNPYNKLNIKNKIVLDIGGSIGDSAIFFAINNAKKIIYVEPYPVNFELAKKNVSENHLEEKIELNLGACAGKSGILKIDPNTQSSMRTPLEENESSFSIPLFTIESLVEKYDTQDIVLKMDCEGCEYESILNTSSSSLQKFSEIIIEFHNGFKNLKKKLEQANFSITKIVYDSKKIGYIIATKNL